jgi:hypothetical protein
MAKTREQKVADKIAELVNDVTLDLDEVGRALVDQHFTISYNRLVLITEAAIQEKENENGRQFDTLF